MGAGRTSGAVRAEARRRRTAKVLLVAALVAHGTLLVRGGGDPHKLFGFRPFNESDTWQADIVRVTADGARLPVDDGTWAYDWDRLVGAPKLQHVGHLRHASAGASASIDFLRRALDWAVDRIPEDRDTVTLEATVTVFRNTRGPEVTILRSVERSEQP